MKSFGVFVGRMCPLHIGHEVVIGNMIAECGGENNCVVMVGSANASLSLRHFFSYQERRKIIKAIFPNLRVIGIPDYPTNEEWMNAVDDLLSFGACGHIAAKIDPAAVIFFGGCEEDIQFFADARRKTSIINRFDGSTPKISATEVRDALIQGRTLEGLLNPSIIPEVQHMFLEKWEHFKRM